MRPRPFWSRWHGLVFATDSPLLSCTVVVSSAPKIWSNAHVAFVEPESHSGEMGFVAPPHATPSDLRVGCAVLPPLALGLPWRGAGPRPDRSWVCLQRVEELGDTSPT